MLRNLRYLGINNFIQSYEYFKKYFEYEKKKTLSQHLLKMNRNIWMDKCKIIKKSARCIENLERSKGWVTLVTLEAANDFEPETNKWEVNILNIYIYTYIYVSYI